MYIQSQNRGLQIPLNNAIEDSRTMSSNVSVQINFMPLFLLFIIISSILTCFIFFIIEGRIVNYIPTISEIATSSPNSDVFSIFQAVSSIFLIIIFTLYISAVDTWNAISPLSVIICRVLSYLSPLCFLAFSCCSIEDNHLVHNLSLVFMSFSFFAFFAITLLQMRKILVKSVLLMRSIFLFVIFLSFLSILFFTIFDDVSNSLYAITEYVFFTFSGAFILSFSKDLSLIRLQVVTLDNNNNEQ